MSIKLDSSMATGEITKKLDLTTPAQAGVSL